MKDYRTLIGELPREARERLADSNPLSFSQQRLWFLDQMDPENAAYNIPAPVRLEGPLNLQALERSFNEIIRRHEVLRTTFPSFDGRPLQLIEPAYELPLNIIDLTDTPLEAREGEATRFAIEEISKPFDLTQLPLIRVLLLRLADDDHIAVVTMHHSVSDGWSVGIFIKEMASLYNRFSRGEESSLPELPIQYADFSHWQRDWLASEDFDEQLDYWKKQVAGAAPVLELPTDFARPVVQTFNGAEYNFALSTELSAAVKSLSRRKQTTEITVLMTAFIALLHRYTEQRNIVIGLPVAGRSRVELEHLIGFFVNTLIIRSDLSPEVTFGELIDRIHETALDAYAHQDLPFEKLVEHLQPERNLGTTPLFQVMFVPQNSSSEAVNLNGLKLSPHKINNRTAKFDLILCVGETDRGWSAALEYNTDLFRPQTMERMARHFQTLLTRAIENPDQSMMSLSMLDEDERRQLLIDFNQTSTDYQSGDTLNDLVNTQAATTPERIALVSDSESLTYRALNRRANQLARHLRKLGVGPETVVGICIERSVEMVVGLLGILKSGGAYLPLDPEYPQERRAFMLQDAGANVVLTQERLRSVLPESGATVLALDADWADISSESEDDPNYEVTPENLAYVIYTSGSTGKPKGTMLSHRGICNRLLWMRELHQLNELDRVLQKTPYSFDVSVWEFFWPLITGATLVMARPGGHRDSAYLVDVIDQQKITVCHFVPSMLRVFLEEKDVEQCRSLRHVFCSGEALPADLAARFFSRLNARLHNLYGPTEASVEVTYWECRRSFDGRSVPIGKPIGNTQMHVLSRDIQPAPIGLPGELHIGGVGLARGYLNRPGLTAEKFIPDPFSGKPGARLYRTGDLSRWLSEGDIEYLGRIDNQVKIRGYRIELGEIEAVLSTHPAVREVVVCAHDASSENKILVAYIVYETDQSASVTELRTFLQSRLPELLVPSVFVPLPELPLLPNGKMNRGALPKPGTERPELEKAYVAPRTAVEEQLAQIWARMLKIDQVGINDNFFELGGHSLLATQVISQVREAFMVELSPRRLFEEPTIERLAVLITQLQASQQDADEINEWLNHIENLTEAEARALLEATV